MNVITGTGRGATGVSAADRVAGIDEAGRGPLAGPVVAAAVILDPRDPIGGLADSKRLTARRRDSLAKAVREHALAWSIVRVGPEEIDGLNIFQATMAAMRESIRQLPVQAAHALVDGNRCPELPCPATPLVGGDGIEPAISAASILAKVDRDAIMVASDQTWPGYGFARHKGYPTREHLAALRRLGPTPLHRRSFAPVREALQAPELPFDQ